MRAKLNLCLMFSAMTVTLAEDGPRLVILPAVSEYRRPIGDSGYLRCLPPQDQPSSSPVVWTDPRGQTVPEERSRRVYSTPQASGRGRELYLTNVTEEDSGEYTCSARYGDSTISKKFNLLVYMKMRWVDAPEQQNPIAGTRAKIKCIVKANPPAIVEWLDGNGNFILKTDRYTPRDTGFLEIENITSADDGLYLCRAKVPAEGEMAERQIKVEVYSSPEITLPLRDSQVEIVESQEGSIRCQASGRPAPERTWYGPSGSDASKIPGLTVDADGTLSFRPASRRMAGKYRCSAKNKVATVETSVTVVVIVRPKVVRFENITSAEGQSTKLVCRVTGSPPPTVSFRKIDTETIYRKDVIAEDDRMLVRQSSDGDEQVGELSIRDLSRMDAGGYDCSASNLGGQVSAPGRLTVQYRPVLTGPEGGEVFSWIGQPVELVCTVEAEPAATVGWTRGGRRPEQDAHMHQTLQDGDHTAVLTVTPVDNGYFGVYRCSASNSQGSSNLDVTLREATPPGSIHGAAVQDLTATSATFSIPPAESDGGLPVRTVLVQYVVRGQSWHDTAREHEWPVEGPFLLHDLVPEQTYLFRFAAANEVGAGLYSDELQQLMPKINVPHAPTFVSSEGEAVTAAASPGADDVVTSDGSDSYLARWTAGADNGAEVDSFQLSYHKVIFNKKRWRVVSSSQRTSVVEMPGPLTFRLTDLKPDSFYRLELRAHNRIGYSEPAQVIVRTAEGVVQAAAAPVARSSNLVVGIVIAALLVVLVLCDLTCYAVNNRGLTHMLCSRAKGSPGRTKLTEDVASEKEPLQENGNANKRSPPPPPEANGERMIRLPRQTSV